MSAVPPGVLRGQGDVNTEQSLDSRSHAREADLQTGVRVWPLSSETQERGSSRRGMSTVNTAGRRPRQVEEDPLFPLCSVSAGWRRTNTAREDDIICDGWHISHPNTHWWWGGGVFEGFSCKSNPIQSYFMAIVFFVLQCPSSCI